MNTNVGNLDRVLRISVGVALIAFAMGYILPNSGWNAFGWIGVVPLLTGIFKICPAYSIFGISSCSGKACCGGCCSTKPDPAAK